MSATGTAVPVLAVLGHPNAGKSSVVATLTENDRIPIDKRSGTTTQADDYPVIIDGRCVLRFIDTPGFQNPSDILEWFQAHPDLAEPASAFVAAHDDDPVYSHDCALLRPVAAGAGIILVVDGSRRIKEKDRVEMELLRLTGRPRLAILNNLTVVEQYLPGWQDALNKAFNSVRLFNAHRATYAERIKLLNALKTIDQRWEPQLAATIRAFELDWAQRIDASVTTILELLKAALSLRVSRTIKADEARSDVDWEAVKAKLTADFQARLRHLEQATQARIREHFRHNVWHIPPESLLGKDLFAAEVYAGLGLSQKQLALGGMAAGATTGGLIDLGVGGLSFGTGALLGGISGGVLSVLGSAGLAKMDVKRTLGVARVAMGPVSHPQFPFVLLDRSILYCARAMNWAHGRQAADEDAAARVPERALRQERGFAEALPMAQQKTLHRLFADYRKGRVSQQEAAARDILTGILRGLSDDEIDSQIGIDALAQI